MKSIRLKAYAKINLGLAVIGRRPDGFHELRTVYQSISLADRVEVAFASGAPTVHLETSGFEVPAGRDNLAVRAAEVVLKELDLRRRVTIRLQKRIPPGSGLGGASSDAAAVLRALLWLAGETLALDRLLHLAARLGSDVPFFLFGGRMLGTGRGEEVYPLPEELRRYGVIVFPGEGLETAAAYRKLRRPLLTTPAARPTIERFCGRMNGGAWNRLANDFEPLAFSAFPQLAAAKKWLLRCGAEMASLTGSGSAIFGIFRGYEPARAAAGGLRRPDCQVWVMRTVSRREYQQQLPFARHLASA